LTRRFRLLAGPNGSGKTTLKRRLERDYAVNFYDFLNADEIFAEVQSTGAYAPRLAIEQDALSAAVEASSYDESVKAFFRQGEIVVSEDCVRFKTPASVNSYTVALLTAFLSAEHVRQGMSFSISRRGVPRKGSRALTASCCRPGSRAFDRRWVAMRSVCRGERHSRRRPRRRAERPCGKRSRQDCRSRSCAMER